MFYYSFIAPVPFMTHIFNVSGFVLLISADSAVFSLVICGLLWIFCVSLQFDFISLSSNISISC